jgi:hypothetical protein
MENPDCFYAAPSVSFLRSRSSPGLMAFDTALTKTYTTVSFVMVHIRSQGTQ